MDVFEDIFGSEMNELKRHQKVKSLSLRMAGRSVVFQNRGDSEIANTKIYCQQNTNARCFID